MKKRIINIIVYIITGFTYSIIINYVINSGIYYKLNSINSKIPWGPMSLILVIFLVTLLTNLHESKKNIIISFALSIIFIVLSFYTGAFAILLFS